MTGPKAAGPTRLVISNADLPGLVAAVIASEEIVRRESLGGGSPAVWSPAGRTHDAVARHAKSIGVSVIRGSERAVCSVPGNDENRLLLDAGTAALGLACPVVVWPVVHRGAGPGALPPVETIAASINRATLVSRLLSLDAAEAGLPEVRIETPFVDLTDQQLAELACDLGVRFEDCWWWSDHSPEASGERARWGPLLPIPA